MNSSSFLRRAFCFALAVLGLSARFALAEEVTGYRLTVELQDGSRIIGQARDMNLEFTSDTLGDLKLPLAKILGLQGLTRTNRFNLITVGGDNMTVRWDQPSLRLEASFGAVKLPVELVKSLRVSPLHPAGRPMDGLISLWSAEGNGRDSISGRDGALCHVSFVEGVSGQAFLFAPDNFPYGTWTGVQIADQPAFALTKSLSIECWIRPRGNGYMIFFRGDHRPGLDPYHLSLDGQMNLEFGICSAEGATPTVKTPVAQGAWIHAAGVLDDATGTMSLYTNGVLAARLTTPHRPFGPLIPSESPGVGIGNVFDGGNNFPFNGEIDEVGLYDRALTEAEVRGLFYLNEARATDLAPPLPARRGQVIRSLPPRSFPGVDGY